MRVSKLQLKGKEQERCPTLARVLFSQKVTASNNLILLPTAFMLIHQSPLPLLSR